MPPLNEFQLSTQQQIHHLLAEHGWEPSTELGGGPREFAAVVTAKGFRFWIYPDGADVSGNGVDRRFEIYDFASLDALKEAYIGYVGSLLHG